MKRVMIIGCGGSGKSTLARKLGEKTGLPVYAGPVEGTAIGKIPTIYGRTIEIQQEKGFFDKLPTRLQTIALLREQYPDSSYDELSYYSDNLFGKKLNLYMIL